MFNPRTLDGEPFDVAPETCRARRRSRTATGGRFRIRATALDGRELVLDGSVSPVARRRGDRVPRRHRRARPRGAERALPLRALQLAADPAHRRRSRDDRTRHRRSTRRSSTSIGFEREEIVGAQPPFPWWDPDEDATPGFDPARRAPRLPAATTAGRSRSRSLARHPRRRRRDRAAARRDHRPDREAAARPAARAERQARRDRRARGRRRARDQQPALRDPRADRVPAQGVGARARGRASGSS